MTLTATWITSTGTLSNMAGQSGLPIGRIRAFTTLWNEVFIQPPGGIQGNSNLMQVNDSKDAVRHPSGGRPCTSSPGATIRPGAEWDKRSLPSGPKPWMALVSWNVRSTVRRASFRDETSKSSSPRYAVPLRSRVQGSPSLACPLAALRLALPICRASAHPMNCARIAILRRAQRFNEYTLG